jgi:hypothetical protein
MSERSERTMNAAADHPAEALHPLSLGGIA